MGLAGAAESEEQGSIAFGPLIGGAMHAQDAFFVWEQVVEYGKDGFFHFPGVASSGDEDEFVAEGNDDGCCCCGCRNGRCRAVGWDRIGSASLGEEVLEFFFGRPEEHIMGEEVGAGGFGDDADVQAKAGVSTDGAIADIDFRHAVQPGSDG